jgi:hypothetical protein
VRGWDPAPVTARLGQATCLAQGVLDHAEELRRPGTGAAATSTWYLLNSKIFGIWQGRARRHQLRRDEQPSPCAGHGIGIVSMSQKWAS